MSNDMRNTMRSRGIFDPSIVKGAGRRKCGKMLPVNRREIIDEESCTVV